MWSDKRSVSENSEAESLGRWLSFNGYKFTHIGNESGLPSAVARMAAIRKKRMWTSPGFPDYCIILKRGALMFIELKRRRTRKKNGDYSALSTDKITVETEQLEWISALDSIENVAACVAYWWEDARNKIIEIENF